MTRGPPDSFGGYLGTDVLSCYFSISVDSPTLWLAQESACPGLCGSRAGVLAPGVQQFTEQGRKRERQQISAIIRNEKSSQGFVSWDSA